MVLTQLINDPSTKMSKSLDIIDKYGVEDLLLCDSSAEMQGEIYRKAIEERYSEEDESNKHKISVQTIQRSFFNEAKGRLILDKI